MTAPDAIAKINQAIEQLTREILALECYVHESGGPVTAGHLSKLWRLRTERDRLIDRKYGIEDASAALLAADPEDTVAKDDPPHWTWDGSWGDAHE